MAAPTGKAAARLKASVNAMRSDLDCPESVKDAIPGSVVTLHRLLGGRSGKGAFRHGIINPLPFDMVIVDEASMIALPLMNALFSALQPEARLLLLGDRDQLASVEAGAVLGDICSAGEADPDSSLGRSVVVLEKNYRFSKESGIGELSQAVNAGRGREAMNLLESTESSALFWQEISTRRELTKLLGERVISRYSSYFESTSPADALERFERFRILAALRDGPFGVIGLNFEIERMLRRSNLLSSSEVDYRCRPLLVTANDYTLQLFNGDTGILFPDVSHGGALRAFFYSSDGGIRSIAPVRLPRHETAFAMTVHKSQGSEFERVVLVLPNIDSEILSRELLYTAITRAKKGVEIWGGRQIFGSAVRRKIKRCSGLADALLHADDEQ